MEALSISSLKLNLKRAVKYSLKLLNLNIRQSRTSPK